MAPFDSRCTQVGINLTLVQVCATNLRMAEKNGSSLSQKTYIRIAPPFCVTSTEKFVRKHFQLLQKCCREFSREWINLTDPVWTKNYASFYRPWFYAKQFITMPWFYTAILYCIYMMSHCLSRWHAWLWLCVNKVVLCLLDRGKLIQHMVFRAFFASDDMSINGKKAVFFLLGLG